MSLAVLKSPHFPEDFEQQYAWYGEKAGWTLAERYASAIQATLDFLATHPAAGRRRRFRHPSLRGVRSFQVQQPFHRHLVFYRFNGAAFYVERVLHGARNLPRRLTERPSGKRENQP